MVFHIVLFQPRPDLAPDELRGLLEALTTAVGTIPSVRGCRIGRRVVHGVGYEAEMPQNLGYAAVIEFEDVAGLKAYLRHPAHEPVSARFRGLMEVGLIYDYEMMTPHEARVVEGFGL